MNEKLFRCPHCERLVVLEESEELPPDDVLAELSGDERQIPLPLFQEVDGETHEPLFI